MSDEATHDRLLSAAVRMETALEEWDRQRGELFSVVARLEGVIWRGNGHPPLTEQVSDLRAEVGQLQDRCSSCPNAVAIGELRARVDERQSTMSEIVVPDRAARTGGRAVVIAAFVGGVLALVSAIGGPWLAWHLATRTAQAHTLQMQVVAPP